RGRGAVGGVRSASVRKRAARGAAACSWWLSARPPELAASTAEAEVWASRAAKQASADRTRARVWPATRRQVPCGASRHWQAARGSQLSSFARQDPVQARGPIAL